MKLKLDKWVLDDLFELERSPERFMEWETPFTSSLKGCKRHPLICQSISEGRKGITFTEEHRRNLSLSHRGPRSPLSQETKDKISQSNSGRRRTPKQKDLISKKTREKMKELNQETYWFISPEGEVFCETTTLSEFGRKHNLNRSLLSRVLTGHRNHHKGWKVFLHNPVDK